MEAILDKTLIVSEHVSQRVSSQKITPAQAMGDIMVALLERMTPQEQMVVEKKLNEQVALLDEKTRNEVLVWRSPYEPKTETVLLTLTFEGEHKVPVSFTQVGDNVIMTVKAWIKIREHGERSIIILSDIPEKYRPKCESSHSIHVFNDYFTSGSIAIRWITASLYAMRVVDGTNYVSNFNASGKVGFPQFTVTYSLK